MHSSLCVTLTMLNISITNYSSIAFNDTTGPWRYYSPLDTPLARGARTAAYAILLLLEFVGNVLVIHITRRNPTLRSTVDLLIVNMCVSDLFIPLFAIPYRLKIIYLGDEWIGGDLGSILCKLVPFVIDVSTVVSILSLLAIAVERFRAIVCATKLTLFTVSSHRRLIALIWMIAVIAYCVYFYVFITVHFGAVTVCVPQWHLLGRIAQIYLTSEMVLLTAIPTLLLFVLYTTIIKSLRRQQEQVACHLGSEALRRRATQNRKITIMLIIVVCIFVLSYNPFTVYVFLLLYNITRLEKMVYLQFGSIVLVFVPGAVNPAIYFTFNDRYRQGLKHLLCSRTTCQLCCGRSISPEHATHSDVNLTIEMQELA